MKQTNSIYSLLLTIVFVMLLSCKAGNREAYKDYALEDETETCGILLHETFQSDSVSEANLRAFEKRAIQKLHDVMDLIEILSDQKTEPTFRKQAKSMLLENFKNPDENRISLILPDIKPFRYTVSQFADTLLNNGFLPLKLKILESSVKRPLSIVDKNKYLGTIYFQMEPTANFKTLYPKDVMVNIVLKKVTKDFGGSSQEVWEVFLGDVGD